MSTRSARRLRTPSAFAIRFRCGFTPWLAPGIYTPGIARDHGYRLAVLGADRFAGRRVIDIGAFDGFYSFLAEVPGARRVVAVDDEEYVDWVCARFGVTLPGGVGFRAIAGLVGSRVEYRRWTRLTCASSRSASTFALCFGICTG
jgi:tRNA (mo5U34)-methyltransferase